MKKMKTRRAYNIRKIPPYDPSSSESDDNYEKRFNKNMKEIKNEIRKLKKSEREKGGGERRYVYEFPRGFDQALSESGDISRRNHFYNLEEFVLKRNEIPAIHPSEFKEFMENRRVLSMEDEESSFNDDRIRPSEEEFFSSEYVESDIGDYVPPLTRTKKALIAQLIDEAFDPNDDESEHFARFLRRHEIINKYQDMILKKRIFKAYKALKYVLNLDLAEPRQEAILLREFEIRHKKLVCPFYYERDEPKTFTKLLKKRLKAITRKYELYALDPEFRQKYTDRIKNGLHNAIIDLKEQEKELELKRQREEEKEKARLLEEQRKAEMEKEEKEEVSSFYDDKIPDSELEFFSSDWDLDDLPRPMPQSRTLTKYYGLLAKYHENPKDPPEKANAKRLKRLEIKAQFENYCERRRTVKKLARFKTVEMLSFRDPFFEGDKLMRLEMFDKKLNRDFYYTEDESYAFRSLLFKRIRAIMRKYNKYSVDPEFRQNLKEKVLIEMMKVKDSPLFDKMENVGDVDVEDDEDEEGWEDEDEDEDETSSFNDSEIPSSEEEFMSPEDDNKPLKMPDIFRRPITRRRRALYDKLEKFEINYNKDSDRMINAKRKARLNALERYYDGLRQERKDKAIARLKKIKKMGSTNPQRIADELMKLELKDKKLNRPYYYMPNEHPDFKLLLQKRRRAIRKKCERYANDENFRKELEEKYKNMSVSLSTSGGDSGHLKPNTTENKTFRSPMYSIKAKEIAKSPMYASQDRSASDLWEKVGEDSLELGPFCETLKRRNYTLQHFADDKKARRRDYKLQNVIPRRESAPGKLVFPVDDFNASEALSMGYGCGRRSSDFRYQFLNLIHPSYNIPDFSRPSEDWRSSDKSSLMDISDLSTDFDSRDASCKPMNVPNERDAWEAFSLNNILNETCNLSDEEEEKEEADINDESWGTVDDEECD